MEKYLNQLTALEKEFQKNITFVENQSKSHEKMQESFKKLGKVERVGAREADEGPADDGPIGKDGDASDPDQAHNKVPTTNIEKL